MLVARQSQRTAQQLLRQPRRLLQRPFTCASSPKGFTPGPTSQPAPSQPEQQASNSEPVAATADDDELDIERRVRRGKNRRRIAVPKVTVVSEQVEAVKSNQAGGPLKPESQAETAVVTTMVVLFSAIIIEGLVLAASGFLPEEVDLWIQDVLYPSYSPTLILFLAISTLYGLGKTGLLPGQQQRDN